MSEGFTSYSVDNDRRFRETLDKVSKEVQDLRIPLTLISKDFFKSQRAIWKLSGRGQYPDLAESTKNDRLRRKQSIYPILRRSGALEKSMTVPTDPMAVDLILNRKVLVMGTRHEYGVFHQSDKARRNIPLRKFLFIGPEAKQFATSDQMGRLERWLGILNGFVMAKSEALGTVKVKDARAAAKKIQIKRTG